MPVPCAADEHFIQPFEGFHQVVLEGCQCCTDGWASEAVGDEAEMSQTALHARLQDQ